MDESELYNKGKRAIEQAMKPGVRERRGEIEAQYLTDSLGLPPLQRRERDGGEILRQIIEACEASEKIRESRTLLSP